MITIGVIAFILGILVINSLFSAPKREDPLVLDASSTTRAARRSISASINNSNGVITGQLTNGTNYTVNGPVPALAEEVNTLKSDNVIVTFANPSSLAAELLPYLIWILIFAGFMYYASRQARGQMNGMMSVGSLAGRSSSTKIARRRRSLTSRATSA